MGAFFIHHGGKERICRGKLPCSYSVKNALQKGTVMSLYRIMQYLSPTHSAPLNSTVPLDFIKTGLSLSWTLVSLVRGEKFSLNPQMVRL